MPRTSPAHRSSVRQLCQLYDTMDQQPQPQFKTSVKMDHTVQTAGDIRTRFLHNLEVFEQRQTTIPCHGSNPTKQNGAINSISSKHEPSNACLVSSSENGENTSRSNGGPNPLNPVFAEQTCCPVNDYEVRRSVSLMDNSVSRNSRHCPKESSLSKDLAPELQRSRSHSPRTNHDYHQPVIRGRKCREQEGERARYAQKSPLLGGLSSHSGLGNRLRLSSVTAPCPQEQSPAESKDVTTAVSRLVLHPYPLHRRQSVADPQNLVHREFCEQNRTRSHESSTDTRSPQHRSRKISTASIQLKGHVFPQCRKRSHSEERRISVIKTSKCFPETLVKSTPMLDEWLTSLMKQTRIMPNEEDLACDVDPIPVRQEAHNSLCSDHSWQHTRLHHSHQSHNHHRKSSHVDRQSDEHTTNDSPTENYHFITRTSTHNNRDSGTVTDVDYVYPRRLSKEEFKSKKCERRTSEDKLSPQSSLTGTTVSVHVPEEDEDSACVQSVSDTASVQLCVPLTEDPSTSSRQHLPLSPCSSLGSYHSAVSSVADSAVDMVMLEDETLEVEITQQGSLAPSVKLKQALFADSNRSSSSSSCQTVVDSVNKCPSPLKPSLQPSTEISLGDLPSFLISDHSSTDWSSEAQFSKLNLSESCGDLEPGYMPRSPSAASSSSEGSFCSTCWTDSSVSDVENTSRTPVRKRKQSSWKKIRSIIRWSPFIQVFKKHRYPWIQLAGHQGNFQAGDAGSVLKKLDSREHQSFQRIMSDTLQPFAPEFRGVVEKSGERYIQLQDLLCEFTCPCVMDIKMGVRTYLEEELTKARKKPTLRKDMYQKMVDVDSNAPTAEEHNQRAVTKPRYMQWRDQMSSSVDLGFRIEGIKKSDGASSKDFKKTKNRESVADVLKAFIGDNEEILAKYLQRLKCICGTQETSEFFRSHEVVGSSLLFVHDSQGEVNVWMIDFGKTEPLPKGVAINHRDTWVEGNHEDGYLFGLDNIISILEELQASSVA